MHIKGLPGGSLVRSAKTGGNTKCSNVRWNKRSGGNAVKGIVDVLVPVVLCLDMLKRPFGANQTKAKRFGRPRCSPADEGLRYVRLGTNKEQKNISHIRLTSNNIFSVEDVFCFQDTCRFSTALQMKVPAENRSEYFSPLFASIWYDFVPLFMPFFSSTLFLVRYLDLWAFSTTNVMANTKLTMFSIMRPKKANIYKQNMHISRSACLPRLDGNIFQRKALSLAATTSLRFCRVSSAQPPRDSALAERCEGIRRQCLYIICPKLELCAETLSCHSFINIFLLSIWINDCRKTCTKYRL